MQTYPTSLPTRRSAKPPKSGRVMPLSMSDLIGELSQLGGHRQDDGILFNSGLRVRLSQHGRELKLELKAQRALIELTRMPLAPDGLALLSHQEILPWPDGEAELLSLTLTVRALVRSREKLLLDAALSGPLSRALRAAQALSSSLQVSLNADFDPTGALELHIPQVGLTLRVSGEDATDPQDRVNAEFENLTADQLVRMLAAFETSRTGKGEGSV